MQWAADLPGPAKERETTPLPRTRESGPPRRINRIPGSPSQSWEKRLALPGLGEAGAAGWGSPRRLQDTMGRGLPVATHSSTAV